VTESALADASVLAPHPTTEWTAQQIVECCGLVRTTDRLLRLGQDILAMAQGRPCRGLLMR
jgi:hypothetical protein